MSDDRDAIREAVRSKQRRKERARREGRRGLAQGLGTFGLVGWSIAIPTLLGVALGRWLDARETAGPSWTLTLLLAGVVVGAFIAWYRLQREVHRD